MSDKLKNFPTSNPSWDLESIFPGGAESKEFFAFVDDVEQRITKLQEEVIGLPKLTQSASWDAGNAQPWVEFMLAFQEVQTRFSEAMSFAYCVASSQTDNPKALRLPSLLNALSTQLSALDVELKSHFRGISEKAFEALTTHDKLSGMTLYLSEVRRDAERAMDTELESLAVELNADGLHAWGQLYNQVSARLSVEIADADGKTKTISVAQAKNLLSHNDRNIRKSAHEGLTKTWQEVAPICASAQSAIVGAAQTLYRRRGGDALTDPLFANRVERATVDAMMEAAAQFKPQLEEYMQLKARALGLKKLEIYDIMAPVGADTNESMGYEDAQEFIVEHVASFSQEMGDFYKYAMANQWVEAEDRTGKSQGGYCTTLSFSNQIRIFMTYGGNSSSVTTLAHELGHAYHGWVMRDLPEMEKILPMGLAETASTLSEALVENAALAGAEGKEKFKLLDERLQRAVAFMMDIPARYKLELAIHEMRAKKPLNEDDLSHLTSEIYSDMFGEGLASVDPLFWASKLHFYITQLPFYNFPYTFGYLFSKAVHRRAQQEGPAFAKVVDELLLNTGRMTSEEIGRRYLDVDMTDSKFWYDAALSINDDIAEYREIVQKYC